jgi:cobalt-zinc-cadmium efflux system outer membrane protein
MKRYVAVVGGALIGIFSVVGCATSGVATPDQVSERIRQEAGHPTRERVTADRLPAGVSLDDGLSENEAVAIALWNSSTFQESLADLGIARADVAQAGLLRNPVLTLLLPWGPKQLEATAKWPLDALWQRPLRVAAARVSADAVAERLVAIGLNLVSDAKLAYADSLRALAYQQLAIDNARLARRVAELSMSRYKAGDISELEADTADTEASRAELESRRATLDIVLADNRLHQLLGLADTVRSGSVRLNDERGPPAAACVDIALADLERDALAARPDIRAAELEVEAAGRRLGWEKSRIFSFLAVLDFNAQGKQGAELGPGIETDFGLFDRNQAGVLRANADLDRARARYETTRRLIVRDLRDAHAALATSSASAALWRDNLRPRLERQAGQTERAYEAGELSFLAVIEAQRRLNAGRISELDAMNAMRRALIQLEHRVGRSCIQ